VPFRLEGQNPITLRRPPPRDSSRISDRRRFMAKTFWLDDQSWAAIEPLLPSNQPGARRVDDRRVLSGIIHVLMSGCRWRDCPAAYGPPTTIYNRYNRWSQRGIWTRIFAALVVAAGKPDELLIDSSHVKAHRSAAGGKGGFCSSNWPVAWRAHDQDPHRQRWKGAALRVPAHTRERCRHLGRAAARHSSPANCCPDRRQGL
jgi:transposase